MNNSLGDPLSVKVGEQIDQVKVLQKQRTVGSDSLNLYRKSTFQPKCAIQFFDCKNVPYGWGIGTPFEVV
jgi:hypothetical protein